MVGTILGLVPLDEEIKAEMKYIIPKGFFLSLSPFQHAYIEKYHAQFHNT